MGKVTIDRRFLRQCDVPGCRSRDTVRIKRSAGYSEQLYMCKSCIKETYMLVFPEETKEDADVKYKIGDENRTENVSDADKSDNTAPAEKKKGLVKK